MERKNNLLIKYQVNVRSEDLQKEPSNGLEETS